MEKLNFIKIRDFCASKDICIRVLQRNRTNKGVDIDSRYRREKAVRNWPTQL